MKHEHDRHSKWMILACCILCGLAFTAYGEEDKKLWSIRVGQHDQYTRVVFDMDQSVAYEVIPQGIEGKNLRVVFMKGGLTSEEYILLIDKGLVSRIHVKPQEEKTFAEIMLKKAVEVKEHFRLNEPDRVIIDVSQTEKHDKAAAKGAVKKP